MSLPLVGLLAALPGCRAQAGAVDPEACKPTTEALPADATADQLKGEFRLTLVTTGGEQDNRTSSGRMHLEPYQGSMRQRSRPDGSIDSTVVYAAFGTTDVDLSAVGAAQVGSTMSQDSTQPGVMVMVRRVASGSHPAAHITLRFGSAANRRTVVRFDGGYTVLRVRRITDDGFAGTWESGAPLPRARGHFCAVRKAGEDGKDGKVRG